jgi:hypothetical protein
VKIALFVTGHLRNSPKFPSNFNQFLEGHDTSVFVATWSSYDLHRTTHQIIHNLEFDAEKELNNMFGSTLKGAWIGDIESFSRNETIPRRLRWNDFISKESDPLAHIAPWPERVMDQWYVVKQAYELCTDYNSYDVVIRIRGDMIFVGKPPLPFTSIEDGIHVNGYSWWTHGPDWESGALVDGTGLVPYAVSDQLAWGKPYWMRKYFEYYDHFGPLFAGRINWEGRDGTRGRPGTFLFHSEHMMSYYLLKHPYYKKDLQPEELDMEWHRHGNDVNFITRPEGLYYDVDYYYLFKPAGSY